MELTEQVLPCCDRNHVKAALCDSLVQICPTTSAPAWPNIFYPVFKSSWLRAVSPKKPHHSGPLVPWPENKTAATLCVQRDFCHLHKCCDTGCRESLPCDSTLLNFGPSYCFNSVPTIPFLHPFADPAHPSTLPAGLELGRSPQGCSGLQFAALLSLASCSPGANTCCASVSIA